MEDDLKTLIEYIELKLLKVTASWSDFLQDQHGPRMQNTTLTEQTMSLQAASSLKVTQE